MNDFVITNSSDPNIPRRAFRTLLEADCRGGSALRSFSDFSVELFTPSSELLDRECAEFWADTHIASVVRNEDSRVEIAVVGALRISIDEVTYEGRDAARVLKLAGVQDSDIEKAVGSFTVNGREIAVLNSPWFTLEGPGIEPDRWVLSTCTDAFIAAFQLLRSVAKSQ